MKLEHPIERIDLYPYPNRGDLQGRDMLMAIRFNDPDSAELAYREWRNLVAEIDKEESIGLFVAFPDNHKSDLRCLCSLPKKPKYGTVDNLQQKTAGVIAGIAKVQDHIRELCKEQGWRLIDFAEMQTEVDSYFEVLRSKGHKERSLTVQEIPNNGGYGIFSRGVSTVTAQKFDVETAKKRALEEGPTGWWTLDEIREYANDPESSRLYEQAMNDMGFRRHKTHPGQWARTKRR